MTDDFISKMTEIVLKQSEFCSKLMDQNSALRQEVYALKQALSNAHNMPVLGASSVRNRKAPVGVDRQRAKVATRSRKSV